MVQSRGRWRPAQTPEPVGILRNKDGKTLIATRHRSWERIPVPTTNWATRHRRAAA